MISNTEKTIQNFVMKQVLDPIFSDALAGSGDSDEDTTAGILAPMIVTKILTSRLT